MEYGKLGLVMRVAWKKKEVCGATFPFQNMKEILVDLSKKLNVDFGDDNKSDSKEVLPLWIWAQYLRLMGNIMK
jgi:hypothetical protein